MTPVHAGVRKDLTGRVLAERYELHDVIGGGAMGTVYAATDRQQQRQVAVKVLDLRADHHFDAEYEARFAREAALSLKLSHANIVEVFDTGTSDDVPFIVMELLHGRTLASLLEFERVVDWQRAVRMLCQACEGLAFAHELGLVHRDLKPANCFVVEPGEQVKLLDFGLAKPTRSSPVDEADVTRSTMVMGSPTFMAPEQARGEASIQSDLYSLGVMMFRMVSGQVPFVGRSPIDVIVGHIQSPVPWFEELGVAQSVPISIELVIRRCLEKDPRARYGSALELRDALLEASDPQVRRRAEQINPRATPVAMPITATLPSAPVSVPSGNTELFTAVRPQQRARWPWVALGALALVGVGAWRFMPAEPTPAPVPAAAAPTPAPAPAAAPAPTEPPAPTGPKIVTFRINSIPAGATVRVGSRLLGVTPTSFDAEADASGEATVEFTLERKGYQTITFITTSSGPRLDLVQRLTKGRGNVLMAAIDPAPEPAAPVTPAPATATPAPAPSPVATPAPSEKPAEKTATPELMELARPIATPVAYERATVRGVVPAEQLTTRPRLISAEPPQYSSHARLQKVTGAAVVRCVVNVEGRLEQCRILRSVPLMDEAILESMKTRRYEPGKVNDEAVASELNIVVRVGG
ncbi:MAG: TonB family protein [Myxococcota bacterium]